MEEKKVTVEKPEDNLLYGKGKFHTFFFLDFSRAILNDSRKSDAMTISICESDRLFHGFFHLLTWTS